MLRNKWVVIVILLGPILVIAMLSAAFGDMMAAYEKTGNFKVGYRINDGSVFEENIEDIKTDWRCSSPAKEENEY